MQWLTDRTFFPWAISSLQPPNVFLVRMVIRSSRYGAYKIVHRIGSKGRYDLTKANKTMQLLEANLKEQIHGLGAQIV